VVLWCIERGKYLNIKRTIVLPEELYKKIQDLADKKSVTVAAIIKIACSEYVEQEAKK